eukprot:gnl/TRDRNA2_/TRDRNA2_139300_c0_seq1.p1 gnl/TRDRNA2_/TRDRNA2_139300_c0~~gnl/TRDRNA2_/TRDRNA2_139300_c0_seq1.p1  ORF type:complete len:116 (+),score=10.54 gnl/TRDRNA2_/TRDRNA2_139300_c0_seq1:181-528(+)
MLPPHLLRVHPILSPSPAATLLTHCLELVKQGFAVAPFADVSSCVIKAPSIYLAILGPVLPVFAFLIVTQRAFPSHAAVASISSPSASVVALSPPTLTFIVFFVRHVRGHFDVVA